MVAPPSSNAPAENAAWWKRLTHEQRERHLRQDPAEVGTRDGLPSRVRDRANRTILDAYLRDNPEDTSAMVLHSQVNTPANDRPLLLNYQPPPRVGDTRGLAVVSVGDPDTARQTAVFVPGTRSNISSGPHIARGISRVRRLREEADLLTNDGNTAGVFWLGCKMPDKFLTQAANKSFANAGYPVLRNFLFGLRAARRKGDPGRTTVIGYSYGSIVVARAAATTQGRFPADAIVFEGSTGLGGVKHASELNVDPAEVYVQASNRDRVVGVPSLVHGANPMAEEFGARVLETGSHGHDGYWDDAVSRSGKVNVICGLHSRLEPPGRELTPGKPDRAPKPRLSKETNVGKAVTAIQRAIRGKGTPGEGAPLLPLPSNRAEPSL
ncbi:alpha/beta hydrolase [Nocardiopsis sp. NPDC006938]|uniref:alpha/beta hydrolase n=1 Tax=Nocardiopsis sp. NPDC006938 TaxID=3364337 RepID=UPI0036A66E11